MDISGLIQSPSYDSRASSSDSLARAMVAPQYIPHNPYSAPPSNNLGAPRQQLPVQHNPFGFNAYGGANINILIPTFPNHYVQQLPLPRLGHSGTDGGRGVAYAQNGRQGFVEELHSQSPPIKSESRWNTPMNSPTLVVNKSKDIAPTTPVDGSSEVTFDTEVDTLMKAIQAKSKSTQPPQQSSSIDPSRPVDDAGLAKASRKRYHCTIKNCMKSFYQKTHLDIHERAHTGVKPYPCREPGCGRSFSQLGNLRTHERRHTGERPYQCEICGKRFAQRGNVRAHKIVHNQAKPYLCRLDKCGKQFTQLGNLKSHQNKFHAQTIRDLTSKFASIKDGDIVGSADKELWEYFANLYKNSNKGIKGRGKDRKVGANPKASSNPGPRDTGLGGGRYASPTGTERGMMGPAAGHGRGGEGQYEMFDADDASQSGSHSGSGGASSVASCDDAPSDGYDDSSRGGALAFGDRIY